MKRYGVVDEFANKTTEVHAIFWGVYKGFPPEAESGGEANE